jgi:peptidoglycan/LPS O-acetylase OafA/YrhL
MKNKKDFKIGILFGIVGFILTLLFAYLATGTFDWRFPAVIGIGFFGGGFLGSVLKRLQQTGNRKTVNLIVFIMICLVLISQIYSLATGQIGGPMWRMIITTTTIIGCIYIGYFIISSLMKSGKKT